MRISEIRQNIFYSANIGIMDKETSIDQSAVQIPKISNKKKEKENILLLKIYIKKEIIQKYSLNTNKL